MKLRNLSLIALGIAAWSVTAWSAYAEGEKASPATAKSEGDSKVGTGPWLTDVVWTSDNDLVASQPQGLLLRPAELVKANSADPAKLEKIGEQETSIWSVLHVGGANVVASNYKGELFLHGSGAPKKFESTMRWVRALSKSPTFGELLAGTEDGKLVVLSLVDLKEVRRADVHTAAIFDIALSAQGDKIAAATGDGTVKILSWPKLETLATLKRGNEAVWAAVFSPDGSRLISGGADRRLQLWDVPSAKLLGSIAVTSDWVTSLIHVPNSNLVVAGCMNGKVEVADYSVMLPVARTEVATSGIWGISLSPNGKQIAVATRKHGLKIIDSQQWAEADKAVVAKATSEKPPAPAKKS